MPEGMTDIHIHILPGVDDGSQDMEDSLLMASLALEGGVDTIIATPHGNMSEGAYLKEEEQEHTSMIREVFEEFRQEIDKRNLPLKVHLGMEIFSTPGAAAMLQQGILLPMNDRGVCMIEFGFEDSALICRRRIEEMLDIGMSPIIAHPERYTCVQRDVRTAEEWVYMGCRLQANRGSILGRFGRKPNRAVWEMLNRGMITFIGSDAHSPYSCTPYMKDVYEIISEEFSPKTAARLLGDNAREYLL